MFYVIFFFKPVKCMDATSVIQLLYYEPMMWILCFKPSYFCGNEPSLYPRDIVETLTFGRSCVFSIITMMISLPGSFARSTWRLIIRSCICSWHLQSWVWRISFCACNTIFLYCIPGILLSPALFGYLQFL